MSVGIKCSEDPRWVLQSPVVSATLSRLAIQTQPYLRGQYGKPYTTEVLIEILENEHE